MGYIAAGLLSLILLCLAQILSAHSRFSEWASSGGIGRMILYALMCGAVVGLISLSLGDY